MRGKSAVNEQPSVLIIEDDPKLASLYSIWLDECCIVKEANDSETAYSYFQDDIDVVLLDRELPDGSGADVLKQIREMELGWSVAIVSGIEPSLQDLEMEFDDYLQKPVERDEITEVVERLYLRAVLGDRLNEFYSLSTKNKMLKRYFPHHELHSKESQPEIERRAEELYTMLEDSCSVTLPSCELQTQ